MLTNDDYKFLLEHHVRALNIQIKECEEKIKTCDLATVSSWYIKKETFEKVKNDLITRINNLTNNSNLEFMEEDYE